VRRVVTRTRRAALLLGLLAWPSPAGAQRIAVISDLNGSYGSTSYEATVGAAVERLVALEPDLVLITGDMVAGQRLHPPLPAGHVAEMWRAFHAAVTTPLRAAGIPVAVTPGNHDASAYPGFVAERDAYRAQWLDRDLGLRLVDRGNYPFHYAFALDDVLLVSLDVTTVGPVAAEQRAWLERVLAAYGTRYRHRIVFSHLPIHPFAQGRATEVSADTALEAQLARHGVEVYLSGHHHAFYPGAHGGIRFVSQACLGAGPRALLGEGRTAPHAVTLIEPAADGSLSVEALLGPDFTRRIARTDLPERVGVLVRDDLRPGGRTP
jgi:hypothetical protein